MSIYEDHQNIEENLPIIHQTLLKIFENKIILWGE
jgi:hypothetical protein